MHSHVYLCRSDTGWVIVEERSEPDAMSRWTELSSGNASLPPLLRQAYHHFVRSGAHAFSISSRTLRDIQAAPLVDAPVYLEAIFGDLDVTILLPESGSKSNYWGALWRRATRGPLAPAAMMDIRGKLAPNPAASRPVLHWGGGACRFAAQNLETAIANQFPIVNVAVDRLDPQMLMRSPRLVEIEGGRGSRAPAVPIELWIRPHWSIDEILPGVIPKVTPRPPVDPDVADLHARTRKALADKDLKLKRRERALKVAGEIEKSNRAFDARRRG